MMLILIFPWVFRGMDSRKRHFLGMTVSSKYGRKKSLKIEQTGSRPNQITSKMGEHEEIFTTAEIEIDIETPDCFEHMLGTGSVTLKFPALNKFIQMNTVWRPKAKKKKIMNIWQMQ